jgi:hypothetical protein
MRCEITLIEEHLEILRKVVTDPGWSFILGIRLCKEAQDAQLIGANVKARLFGFGLREEETGH